MQGENVILLSTVEIDFTDLKISVRFGRFNKNIW